MSLLDSYVKGTKCWFTDEKEGWVSAEMNTKDVTADGKVTMNFTDESGKVTRLLAQRQDCAAHRTIHA